MWAAPLSVAAILDIGRRTVHLDPIQAMRDIKTYPSYRAAVDSDDAKEGNDAFIEKRSPVWKGRRPHALPQLSPLGCCRKAGLSGSAILLSWREFGHRVDIGERLGAFRYF